MSELTAAGAITAADIYRELVGMQIKLAVIENQNTTAERVHNDHEARLRSVERFRWVLFGASSAVGTIAAIIANLISTRGR